MILCVLTVFTIARVMGHASPRAVYYGHRVSPQERLSQIPSVLYEMRYPAGSIGGIFEMPTCSQLRYLWKSSLRDISDAQKLAKTTSNFVDNPYYMTMLWHQNKPTSYFGRIVTEEPEKEKGGKQSSRGSATAKPTAISKLPGRFEEPHRDLGVIYGHVVNEPSELKNKPKLALGPHKPHDSQRHNSIRSEEGKFGRFVAEVEVDDDKESDNNDGRQNQIRHPPRTQSSSAAAEFFNSGVWHNGPVQIIPPV